MEIPEQHRPTVLTLYRLWMFLIIVLAVNLVGAIFLLISGGTPPVLGAGERRGGPTNSSSIANNGGADLGAAIMYLPVIGVSQSV